ncbi:MAG TPA: hypothetical protein VJY35_03175 [Candidatus Eisenbacteria bacterium]|nr:hypothetical protein [Candidatus Eisenbacteria bacterium]
MQRPTSSALSVAALILLAAPGCGHRLNRALLPDARPEVTLAHAAVDAAAPGTYAFLARWTGTAMGRPISHFVYAVDPVSVDRVDDTWTRTTATQQLMIFPDAEKGSAARRPHVFVVRAVDDRGGMSEPRWFAVTAVGTLPYVFITDPAPNPTFPAVVPPSIRIDWAAMPDGAFFQGAVRFTFRLFGTQNPDYPQIADFVAFARTYPDSVRALYAPNFPGWTSVGAETTSTSYTNLVTGSDYAFVITGFDVDGDYDPIFSFSKNMLHLRVSFEGTVGPLLTMFNESFNYTYPAGGYYNDAAHTVTVDLPSQQPVTINWFAHPLPGANIRWYRWVLSPVDLTDETPRSNEATDWNHWSARSLNTTSATVGPFTPQPGRLQSHLLFIEVEDTNGLRSLGIVNFIQRRPAFERDLLFVDDTRFRVDYSSTPGQIDPPSGPWPSSAELDTFLFAKGGFPWRGYPIDPSTGQQYLSPPGIFNGYEFDTLSTRGLIGGMTLAMLSGYRHVVWYTDEAGASYTGPPGDPTTPISELRRMSSPGQSSPLAAYVQQGGKLWLCGGGSAFATLIAWNRPGTPVNMYSARDLELAPGRFMYDFSHWREAIEMLPAVNARKFGLNSGGSAGVGPNRPGRHWPPNPPPPTPPAPPNYALMPTNLDTKTPSTDPLPPLRSDGFPSSFYRGDYMAEYIQRPTFIREDYNNDLGVEETYSTLDTLYLARGGSAVTNAPVMTYYHGRDSAPMVFSGFNLWYWRRSQCIQLADWVLRSVWGLQRDPGAPRESMGAPMAARRAAGHDRMR